MGSKAKLLMISLVLIFTVVGLCPTSPVATQDASATSISPGIQPQDVEVNPSTNLVYVANFESGNVIVIDGDANLVIAAIAIGRCVDDIAVDSVANKVYVNNIGVDSRSRISIIDEDSKWVVGQVDVAGRLALNSATKRLYVAHYPNTVSVIDIQSMLEVATIQVGRYPKDVAVNVVTNMVYVANWGDNTVSVIDGNNNVEVATVWVGNYPSRVAVDSAANRIYVIRSDGLAVLDGGTNRMTLELPFYPYFPSDVAVDVKTSRIYAATSLALQVIDGKSNSFVASVPYGSCQGASGVAVNPSTKQVYVTHPSADKVTVVDAVSNIVLGSIPIGENGSCHLEVLPHARLTVDVPLYPVTANCIKPIAIQVNPETSRVYVVCEDSNNVAVIDGNANQVIATIGVEEGPNDLAVDSSANRIYVSNWFSKAISVIDGNTNVVVGRISVNGMIQAITQNSATKRLYIVHSSYSGDVVSVIDTESEVEIATIQVGDSPKDMAVNVVTNMVYVANWGDDTISVIDGDSNQVIETIENTVPISFGATPRIAVDSIENRVYIDHLGGILVIDGTTNEVIADIPIESFILNDLIIHPETGLLYVTHSVGLQLLVIDSKTLEVVKSMSPCPKTTCYLAVDHAASHLYIATSFADTVTVLETTSYEVVKVIPIGSKPSAVEVDWKTNRIYVANEDTNTVSIIDGGNNEVIGSIEVGNNPVCLEVDHDKNRVYVACDDELYVINGATDEVIATVECTGSPFEIAFNPSTGLIYITSDLGDGITYVIDSETNTVIDRMETLLSRSIAINPETNKVYAERAVNFGSAPIVVFTEALWSPWGIRGYKYTYAIGEPFFPGYLCGGIEIFDGSTKTLSSLGTILYSPEVERGGRLPLAIDPVLNKVYAAPYLVWPKAYGQVLIIDGRNDTIVRGLYAPGVYSMEYKDIAVDQNTSWVYVLLKDDYVLILDGKKESIITQVALNERSNAERITVNPTSKMAYTANWGTGTVSVIEAWKCSPVAFFELSPQGLEINQDITFDASLSYNPDGGEIISYEWDFGDGYTSTLKNPTHKYEETGTYTVKLTVTDDEGVTDVRSQTITILPAGVASLSVTITVNPSTVKVNQTSTITVQVTDGIRNPVFGATIALSSDREGCFSPLFGNSNSNGNFSSTFTAPDVSEQTTINITATAFKIGYADGSNYEYVLVLPPGTPSLSVTVTANPSSIKPGEASAITVQVTDGTNPVEGATLTISCDAGSLSSESGTIDSNGYFTCTFTAPSSVTLRTVCSIAATATKEGYLPGQDQTQITITSIELWALIVIVAIVAVVAAVLILKSKKKPKQNPS